MLNDQWEQDIWEFKVVRSKAVYNRPLNMQVVSQALAQKILTAIYLEFKIAAGISIRYAGSNDDTNHRYWILATLSLPESRKQEIRQFVRGYIACYNAH